MKHCETCICGRRAPVQSSEGERLSETALARGMRPLTKGPGTVAWDEHLLAWSGYARECGTSQSAERMAERGGFSFAELVYYLGHEPKTWAPR